jgi:nucleotide-binding universal stress UspA family protein
MFHNILVAVDGSPDAELALTEAIDLAESERTRLTLFTAVSQLPATAYLAAGEEVGKLVEDAHADAEAILRRARERVPDDLSVTAVLSEQPIQAALIGQITNGVHDLVVMGSRGRGAIRAALLGSTSHYVLHHSPVPVLIGHADRSKARISALAGVAE